MPKFNEFIKGFEEAEQPKEEKIAENTAKPDGWGGITQNPNRSPLADTTEDLKKMEAQRQEGYAKLKEAAKAEPNKFEMDDDEERSWGPERFPDDEIYEELGDNEYWYKGKSKEEMAKALNERMGVPEERAMQFLEKYGTEYWGEKGKNPYNPQPKQGSFQEVFGEQKEEKPQEFAYTEELGEYNDAYGAKTHSERNLNLHAGNDRDMYNYISANLPALIEKAETDPQGVASSLVRHASPMARSDIDPKNVSPDYVRKLLNGFAEEMSQQDEPFTEKEEDYNDYYGAKTRSEREFNVEAGNDERMYNYILANKARLLRDAKYYPQNVANDIIHHGKYPANFYGIDPKNIRKDYLIAVIKDLGEE